MSGRLGLGAALWGQLPAPREARAVQLREILALIDEAVASGLGAAADPAAVADWRGRVSEALAGRR